MTRRRRFPKYGPEVEIRTIDEAETRGGGGTEARGDQAPWSRVMLNSDFGVCRAPGRLISIQVEMKGEQTRRFLKNLRLQAPLIQ